MYEISHYGVLGMKWGVRRTPEQLGRKKEKTLRKSQKKYDKSYRKNYVKIYNRAADRMNNGLIDDFNKRWKASGKDFVKDEAEMLEAYDKFFGEVFTEEAIKLLGKRPV